MITEKKLKYCVVSFNNEKTQTKEIHLKINDTTGMYIIHRALIHQLQNKREKKADTKTRSEVRGGGKKPWKQKGTGKARAGSSRSPLWRGGGIVFGPKAKIYKNKINRKERKLALRTLLHNKFKNTLIVQDFTQNLEKPKTKNILKKIQSIGINPQKHNRILIIVVNKENNMYLSTRNLPNIELIQADQLNILALLKANHLIITKNALDQINEVYNA